MARSIWKKTLVTSFAWAGLAWGQQPTPSTSSLPTSQPASASRTITVQEQGKPAQKCKVVKSWKTAGGASAYQVQALDTGEIMTIVETGSATNVPGARPGARVQALTTRIFHWGRDRTPPPGTPMAPMEYAQTAPPPVASQSSAPGRVAQTTPPILAQQPVTTTNTQSNQSATPDRRSSNASWYTQTPTPSTSSSVSPTPTSSLPPATTKYAQTSPPAASPAASTVQKVTQTTAEQPANSQRYTQSGKPTISSPPATPTQYTQNALPPSPTPLTASKTQSPAQPTAKPLGSSSTYSQAIPLPTSTPPATARVTQITPPPTIQSSTSSSSVPATPQPMPNQASSGSRFAATPLPPATPIPTRVVPLTPVREAQTTRVYTTSPYGSTVGEVKYVTPGQAKTETVQTPDIKPARSAAESQQVTQSQPALPKPQIPGPALPESKPAASTAFKNIDASRSEKVAATPAPSQPALPKPQIPGPALPESKPAAVPAFKNIDASRSEKVAATPAPVAKPPVADAASGKPTVSPAQPSDWRQSWGKADDHKSTPVPPPPPPPVFTSEPPKPALPQADSKLPDPLQAPDRFARRTLDSKLAAPKETTLSSASGAGLNDSSTTRAPAASQPAAASRELNKPIVLPASGNAMREAPKGPPSPSSVPVMSAGVNTSGRAPANYIPMPAATMPDIRNLPVPPSGPPQIMPQRLLANGYSGAPQSKALGAVPTTNDPEAVNAFVATPSGAALARVSNAFGPTDQGANAMSDPVAPGGADQGLYANNSFGSMPPVPRGFGNAPNPAMMQAAYQRNMVAADTRQSTMAQTSVVNPQQTLAALHESLYPSQRERAAESLATMDWRTNPSIVPALLTSAREDPAATVRASCVRCLAKMKVNTVPVINAVQEMRADTDTRVRHEADLALQVLVPDSRSMLTPAVQPVGAVAPGK